MSTELKYIHLLLNAPTLNLLVAIHDGDREKFDAALAAGADVNAADGEPLFVAAEKKNYAFAKALWEKDASIRIPLARARRESAEAYSKYQTTHSPEDQLYLTRHRELHALGDRLVVYLESFNDLKTKRTADQLTRIAEAIEELRKTAVELMGPQQLDKVPAPAPQGTKTKPGLS